MPVRTSGIIRQPSTVIPSSPGSGQYVYWYNAAIDGIDENMKPQNISKVFGPMPGTNNPAIPGFVDAVLFDKRDGNLYFFKGDKVGMTITRMIMAMTTGTIRT